MKIGFILPLGESESTGRTPTFDEIRSLAIQAEEAGLDSVWVYDHLLYRFPGHETMGVWECWSMLSALAGITSRVELGTLVMPVSWRNPALLAKMAATVDEISGGRLILGLGTGFHEPEFDAFGYPFDHRVDRFEEGIEIITSLLRKGKVDFRGQYFNAPNCEITPRGPRQEGIPVHVACQGPRMLELTARYADGWNTAWFGPVDGIAERREAFDQACERVGRDPGMVDVTVGVHVARPELVPGGELDRAKMLTGTPEEIARAFDAYAAAGVSHIICGALADMSHTHTSRVMETVGDALHLYR